MSTTEVKPQNTVKDVWQQRYDDWVTATGNKPTTTQHIAAALGINLRKAQRVKRFIVFPNTIIKKNV